MVLSGNRKTAYHHALFSYNQLVTQSMVNVVIKTEKHFRIRIIKVGVNISEGRKSLESWKVEEE